MVYVGRSVSKEHLVDRDMHLQMTDYRSYQQRTTTMCGPRMRGGGKAARQKGHPLGTWTHLAEDWPIAPRAAALAAADGVYRMVRIVLAHLGERVRQDRL